MQQPSPSDSSDRAYWRRLIRGRRRALSAAEQHAASLALCQRLLALPECQQATRIGLYLANDGELDLAPLAQALWARGYQLFLPVLHPFAPGHLLMLGYHRNGPLRPNRFGIPEPHLDVREVAPLTSLDLLLCPLVAFDTAGNRLGMGGGFYDRTLARWHQSQGSRPLPVGIAHDCQQVDALPHALWDVPFTQILTPSQHYHFPLNGRQQG